jgi:hypothetical protein
MLASYPVTSLNHKSPDSGIPTRFREEKSRSRVQTHKIHQTIAATRQIEARKLRASLS